MSDGVSLDPFSERSWSGTVAKRLYDVTVRDSDVTSAILFVY
jgi:hypothetical protein